MSAPLSHADYLFLAEYLREHLGHGLGPGKEYLLESRLGPVAITFGLKSVGELAHALRTAHDPSLRNAVLEALMIGETSFFRSSAFEVFRRVILPSLIMARTATRRLRFWSAACSTGQETYSLAMILADCAPQLAHWDVVIVGTDASAPALERAREGSYSQSEVGRGLDGEMLKRHFHQRDGRWVAAEHLRHGLKFRYMNLSQSFHFPEEPFDVVFLRNVLIYFDASIKPSLFARVREAIAPDGYLLLGESETILGLTDQFVLQSDAAPFYRPAPEP